MKKFIVGSLSSDVLCNLFGIDDIGGYLPVYDIINDSAVWTGPVGLERYDGARKGAGRCFIGNYSGDEIESLLMAAFDHVVRVDSLIGVGGMWEPIDGFGHLLPCGYSLAGNRDLMSRNVFMVDGDRYGFMLGLDWLRLVRTV